LAVVVANAGFVDQEMKKHLAELHSPIASAVAEKRIDEICASLGDLSAAAGRMSCIVSGLRAFSRPAEGAPEVIELASSINAAMRTTSLEFQNRARVVTALGPTPAVFADEGRLVQVVVNLLVNAAHAIEPGNADRNEVSVTTLTSDKGWALLEVRDSGAGIPPGDLKRIFEPFFTTKEVGVGTGLGLSICHGIIEAMGGEISVDSTLGKGTTFRISLPPAPPVRAAALAAPDDGSVTESRCARILVIDDEEMMRGALKRILQDAGHDVTCTPRAQEALQLIGAGEHFDVIFSDMMMPTMTGMQFYQALLAINPEAAQRIVFLSGGAVTAQADAFLQSVQNRRMEKPFKLAALHKMVQIVLAAQSPPT
jgi:CheY-like chemotaxis protein